MSFGVLALPKNNVIISSSCGSYTKTGTTLTQVTNFSITIKLTGRPVLLAIVPDGSGSVASINLTLSTGTGAYLVFNRAGAGDVGKMGLGASNIQLPSFPWTIDTSGTPGTATYVVNAACNNTSETLSINSCCLVAFEL